MKKKKKIILIIAIILFLITMIMIGVCFYFRNPNKLNTTEKSFLANNASIVQNINVLNNVKVFGDSGTGLFYDFIDDFSKEYGMDVNTVAFSLGENPSGVSFETGNTLGENEISFFQDHYVLVGKKYEYVQNSDVLNNKKIGVLANDLAYITSYLNNSKNTFVSYENDEAMQKAFREATDIQYILIPLHLYLDTILNNNYSILYHFGDMAYYYKIAMNSDDVLGNILKKYYNEWKEKNLLSYYRDHLFNLFVDSLHISSSDVAAMKSITYRYGFVYNSPYEILSGGNYGGIIAQYLKEFTEFSDVELEFIKYKNYNQFSKAVNKNKVDFFFSYYTLSNSYDSVHSGIDVSYQVVTSKKDSMVLNSLKSLERKEVYVEKNSYLYNYLTNNTNLNIKTYDDEEELGKLVQKNKIIIVDSIVFDTHRDGVFSSYLSRYSFSLNNDYLFKLNTNETFTKLFDAFINYKDPVETIYKGVYNHDKTIQSGTIAGNIAKYFMYLLIAFVLIFLYVYKIAKKVKISKKIKKEDKLKYIDQLTSLKNRNYLSENLENWNKNTIYPQSVIVIDLNNLQYINDTMGYEQGDIQIKSAANVLVKMQLDNSDIIRTNGNEFVIYLIGYQTKQITSYIHKLNKEFKKLPYEYGAAIGYSMIEDDIKSIEDAINEAVEDIKKQKNNKKEAN